MSPTANPSAEPATDQEVLRAEVSSLRAELEATHELVEQTLRRANRMALEAEVANIELAQLLNVTNDALWVIDREFRILRINDAFLKLLGRRREEVLGQRCHEVFQYGKCHGPECPVTRLAQLRTGGRIEFDVEADRGAAGSLAFITTAARHVGIDGETRGIAASFKDITDRRRAQAALTAANAELERLAVLDALTQLANRRRFDAVLEQEWRRATREHHSIAVIMCDVDHFKLYNDGYGHQAGDECLRQVAAAIGGVVHRAGDLAARYGGEEFVLVLPNTPLEGAVVVAEAARRAVQALALPHARSSTGPHVTLSLGVAALVPGRTDVPHALVERADQALYEAKHAGRNRWHAAPSPGLHAGAPPR